LNAAEETETHTLYLGLGSNIDPEINLPRAISNLRRYLEITAFSSVWETPPVGGEGPDFLNAVARAQGDLPADALRFQILRPLEARLGRVRTRDPNAPRPIDLDILILNGQVLEPEIWEQAYWAVPLAELLPDFPHPRTGRRWRRWPAACQATQTSAAARASCWNDSASVA
jgi:2-amino-4-hydroxy-6-hydroxymethyldihydropteridine diphosphokinase